MSALISFENLDDPILNCSLNEFQVLLYYGVIRNSDPGRLKSVYAKVEREILELLNEVDPKRYPSYRAHTDSIGFTDFPVSQRREWLAATRLGIEEIRNTTASDEDELPWDYADKDQLIAKGELLVDMMARSLAKSESDVVADGAATD